MGAPVVTPPLPWWGRQPVYQLTGSGSNVLLVVDPEVSTFQNIMERVSNPRTSGGGDPAPSASFSSSLVREGG